MPSVFPEVMGAERLCGRIKHQTRINMNFIHIKGMINA